MLRCIVTITFQQFYCTVKSIFFYLCLNHNLVFWGHKLRLFSFFLNYIIMCYSGWRKIFVLDFFKLIRRFRCSRGKRWGWRWFGWSDGFVQISGGREGAALVCSTLMRGECVWLSTIGYCCDKYMMIIVHLWKRHARTIARGPGARTQSANDRRLIVPLGMPIRRNVRHTLAHTSVDRIESSTHAAVRTNTVYTIRFPSFKTWSE